MRGLMMAGALALMAGGAQAVTYVYTYNGPDLCRVTGNSDDPAEGFTTRDCSDTIDGIDLTLTIITDGLASNTFSSAAITLYQNPGANTYINNVVVPFDQVYLSGDIDTLDPINSGYAQFFFDADLNIINTQISFSTATGSLYLDLDGPYNDEIGLSELYDNPDSAKWVRVLPAVVPLPLPSAGLSLGLLALMGVTRRSRS